VNLNSRVKAVLPMIRPTPAGGRIHSMRSPRHWFEAAVEKAVHEVHVALSGAHVLLMARHERSRHLDHIEAR